MSLIDASPILPMDQAFTRRGNMELTETTPEKRWQPFRHASVLLADPNGHTLADFAILAVGMTEMNATDLML